MSVSCNPTDLAEPVACLANQGEQVLLAQILYQLCVLNGTMCDPDTLSEIPEVACLSNWDQQSLWAAMVYQLCVWNDSGGGGAQEVYSGIWDDPNGNVTPADQTKGARYAQLVSAGGTGVEWHWQTDALVWA